MKLTTTLVTALALALGLTLRAEPVPEQTVTYRVEQNATVSDIPAGAKHVKFWVSIPDNERYQDVLDFEVVSVPGKCRWGAGIRTKMRQPRSKSCALNRPQIAL